MNAWLAGALIALIAPAGFAQPIAQKAQVCFGCHGANGSSAQPGTPSLGGQTSFFVIAQLFLMREGRRTKRPTPMDPFAKGLSDDDLRAYGELFAKQPPRRRPPARSTQRAMRGAARWRRSTTAPAATAQTIPGSRKCRGSRTSARST